MKKAWIIGLTIVAFTGISQANDDIMAHEITEGKIMATMILQKEDAISEMNEMIQEMVTIQAQIAEQGDTQGKLSALGQYMAIIADTVTDLERISAERTEEIQSALASARLLRAEAQSLRAK